MQCLPGLVLSWCESCQKARLWKTRPTACRWLYWDRRWCAPVWGEKRSSWGRGGPHVACASNTRPRACRSGSARGRCCALASSWCLHAAWVWTLAAGWRSRTRLRLQQAPMWPSAGWKIRQSDPGDWAPCAQGARLRLKSKVGHVAFSSLLTDMALIVHKYGGTSMGSTERIRNVAKRVAKWVRAGHQLVVVPSAMSVETNRLLGDRKSTRLNSSQVK